MAVTNGWGKGAQNNTNGWGKSGTNNIGYGAIYESSYAGDTALIGTSAAFLYSKSSFNQGEADPTPTITGTTGGSFNADAGVVFVDTGTYNSSTGQIDLSATSIGSHIITYTVNGVQSGQTVGVTAVPYASTSSFTFDGINDYINTNFSLDVTTDFSVSAWINIDSPTNTKYYILGTREESTSASSSKGFVFQLNSSREVQARIFTTTSNITQVNAGVVTNGIWANVAFTYVASSKTLKIFKNGTEVGSATGTAAGVTSPDSISIGKAATGGQYSYFDGNIDEVSIWNTALSQSAVTEIASGPNDLTTLTNASNTNLKAWYKF